MLKRLLYIDDNYIDIAIIRTMQKRYKSFEDVSYSMDAKGAINFIKENVSNNDALPDVIFLDLYMNEFTGWEFLDEFKIIFPLFNKTIEIYIISFSIRPKDLSRSKEYMCVKSYFTKPVSQEAFQCI